MHQPHSPSWCILSEGTSVIERDSRRCCRDGGVAESERRLLEDASVADDLRASERAVVFRSVDRRPMTLRNWRGSQTLDR